VNSAVQGSAKAATARKIADTRRLRHLCSGPAGAAIATVGDGEGQRRSLDGTRAGDDGVGADGHARGGGGHGPRRGHRGNNDHGNGGGDEPHRRAVRGHGGWRYGFVGARLGGSATTDDEHDWEGGGFRGASVATGELGNSCSWLLAQLGEVECETAGMLDSPF